MTADEYAATIKTGAADVGVTLAMTALVAEVPLLANPVLNAVVREGVAWLLNKLINKTEFGLFFTFIDMRTSKQGVDFFNAILREQSLPKTATAKEKQAAEANKIRAFNNLVSLRS